MGLVLREPELRLVLLAYASDTFLVVLYLGDLACTGEDLPGRLLGSLFCPNESTEMKIYGLYLPDLDISKLTPWSAYCWFSTCGSDKNCQNEHCRRGERRRGSGVPQIVPSRKP
ncbi:unnamed protein product [Caretta caretta]